VPYEYPNHQWGTLCYTNPPDQYWCPHNPAGLIYDTCTCDPPLAEYGAVSGIIL
jgi:hypothetical protein